MRRVSALGIVTAIVALLAGLYDVRVRKSGVGEPIETDPLEAREVKGLFFTLAPSAAPAGAPDARFPARWGGADAAFQRGVAAFNEDEADAAAEAFEEAVRLAPAAAEAHINLGLVYLRLNRTDDGIRELETALALKPESAAALLGIGKCYFNKGNVAKALEVFRRVVSAAPGSREANEAQSFIRNHS